MPVDANAVRKFVLKYALLAGLLVSLYIISRLNYPLFHSVADIATVFAAGSVFVLVWTRRRLLDNDYYLLIGIAFLFFAFWDLLHLLGNKDMAVFPQYGNLGPTLYIVSRYFLGFSMLIAPLFIKRRLNTAAVIFVYTASSVLLLFSIFYWQNFPPTFIEGVGLTAFKVVSDYIVCVILLISAVFLWLSRRLMDARVFKLVLASLALSIATGLVFTAYIDPFGVTNVVGHFFQIASFFIIYKAFVETIVVKPQDILYRNLTLSEEKYRELFSNMAENVHFWQIERNRDGQIKTWRLVDANPPALKTWGKKSVEEIRGKTPDEIFGPGSEEHTMPIVRKVMAEGVPYSYEDFAPNLNKYFRFTTVPLGDYFITTGADITEIKLADEYHKRHAMELEGAKNALEKEVEERRRIQTDLERISSQHQLALDAARMGWWHFDPVKNCSWWDDRYKEIFGFAENEMLNIETITSRFHPDDLPHVMEKIKAALNPIDRQTYSIEFRILMPDGSVKWIEAHGLAMFEPTEGGLRAHSLISTVADITERKRAEEAVKESEERFRSLSEASPIGVGITSADGIIQYVNTSYELILDYAEGELIGKRAADLYWDPDERLSWISKLQVTGVLRDVELRLRRKDGTPVWVSISISQLLYQGKKAVIGAIQNITERKRTEDKILKQSSILQTINQIFRINLPNITHEELAAFGLKTAKELTQSAYGFIGVIGSDGLLHDAARSNPGRDARNIPVKVGKRRPPRNSQYPSLYSQVLTEGKSLLINQPQRDLESISTPAGHTPIEAFLGIPLIYENKTIGLLALANREGGYSQEELETGEALAPVIVEALVRKRAEDEIAHLASFPELNPNPIIEMDALGNVTYMNPVAKSCFSDLINLGLRHPFMHRLAEIIEKDDRQTTRTDIQFDGHWYEQTLTYNALSENYRIYASDISERKEAEQGQHRSNTELEAANKELEAFSYSVSHDLRAPLRSMAGFSSILLEDYADKLDDVGRQYFGYILNASDLMGKLIDDLLKLSKASRSEMTLATVNLTEIAIKIFAELKKVDSNRTVNIRVASDIQALGDRNLLRIVFENLLGNAWKFTRNTALPEIEVGMTDQNGKCVYFIRDNGAGFDMAYAEKLFQPFQRLHKTTEFPGTGIGLSIVKRIIHRHGGEIWAESKTGEGAIFYFTLD